MARMMSGWNPSSWICWASEREAWPNSSHVSRSRSSLMWSTLVEADVLRPYRYAADLPAGRRPDGGHDGGRHRDARRLAHALGAQRRLRVGLLHQGGHDLGRVEARREQVVGERRVPDPATGDDDL